MRQFNYKAVAQDGTHIQGLVEANDEPQAVQILRGKQLLIIKIADVQNDWRYFFNLKLFSIKQKDISNFTRQFATMIDAGLPVINALQIISKNTRVVLNRIIEDIIRSVEGGESLFKALSKHDNVFSPVYLTLVRVGELAGKLNIILLQLAENLEKQRVFRARVINALIYPALMACLMLVVTIVMVFYMMPQLESIYEQFGMDLPFMTKLTINMATFIRTYWYIFIVVIIITIIILIKGLKNITFRQSIDNWIIKIPYLGILIQKIIITEVLRTFALLVSSGVPIIEALQVVSKIAQNSVYRDGLWEAASNIQKGISLSTSFGKEEFLPEEVIQMIRIGEETGKLDEMLIRLARQFQRDSVLALKTITSALEPVMLIILGLGVFFIVIAIVVPIYNLTSQF